MACFWATSFGKNYRRRDRDHFVQPRRMDAAVCRAEACYPFGRKHGSYRAVKRREFITLLGGTAAWPLAAGAQQRSKIPRIRYLDPLSRSYGMVWVEAFRSGLHDLGYVEDKNIISG